MYSCKYQILNQFGEVTDIIDHIVLYCVSYNRVLLFHLNQCGQTNDIVCCLRVLVYNNYVVRLYTK